MECTMVLKEMIGKEGVSGPFFRHGLFQGQKHYLLDFNRYTKQTPMLDENFSLVPFPLVLPFALESFFCIYIKMMGFVFLMNVS